VDLEVQILERNQSISFAGWHRKLSLACFKAPVSYQSPRRAQEL